MLPLSADRQRVRMAAALKSAGRLCDFYDFVEIAPRVWIVLVADVSVRDPAAMALGSLRSAFAHWRSRFRSRANRDSLDTVLTRVAWGSLRDVRRRQVDVTACTLTYTNAGHPPGIGPGAVVSVT